ncbi:DUF4199 family protein [Aquimarina brevivitae]|uniref:Uncharacterized protein DUF4199 n=1 Tax=Aquimarina brevivitae TaxID=323412 RepID=A0A4Q7P260_9FLAO|nr:DUF4199 family protein [Aquimarina brevivitae]RZS93470.1 uncharacterized protein DUF4199 [Aquimarina brevivitae]
MKLIRTSIGKIPLGYGCILGLVVLLSNIFFKIYKDFELTFYLSSQILINILIISFGIYAFKKSNQGYLSLSQALKIGFSISIIAGIIILLSDIFLADFISDAINTTKKEKEAKWLSRLYYAILVFISNLLLALLISLLSGAIMQKNKEVYDEE